MVYVVPVTGVATVVPHSPTLSTAIPLMVSVGRMGSSFQAPVIAADPVVMLVPIVPVMPIMFMRNM
jgi:hypothetical protein